MSLFSSEFKFSPGRIYSTDSEYKPINFYQEAFRLSNGPIYAEDGWFADTYGALEGQLNAWPLDEGLIDYVDTTSYEYELGNEGGTANIISNKKVGDLKTMSFGEKDISFFKNPNRYKIRCSFSNLRKRFHCRLIKQNF